jgi:ribosome biogenesis GTPase
MNYAAMSETILQGVISLAYGKFYTILTEDGKEFQSVLRGKTRLDNQWQKFSNPVAVGDDVVFDIQHDDCATIEEINPRKNIFSRKDKKDRGKDRKQDIIATNLDVIMVMQSFYDPHLNLRFVDRIAVRAVKEKIPLILCINKLDLAGDDYCEHVKSYYRGADIEIFFASGQSGEGIDPIRKRVIGKRVILVGYSGVGKTTILNRLYPGINLRTSEVSASTGKGRHTTTNVMLKRLSDGTELIDTPGMREFGLMDMDPYMISKYFYEFGSLDSECSFRPCSHDHEPGCAIKKAVDDDQISEERYISYINILNSVKEYNTRIYSK